MTATYSPDDLESIRRRLPYGAGRQIARQLGIHPNSVMNALQGFASLKTTIRVVEAAEALIDQHIKALAS